MYHQVAVARDSVTLSFLIFFFFKWLAKQSDSQEDRGLSNIAGFI